MANILISLDPVSKTKCVSSSNACVVHSGKLTEVCPPLDCADGDKLILFFKDHAVTANGSGIIVGDIIVRRYVSGKYEYHVAFDDSLLTNPSVLVTQCDLEGQCCYNCVAKFAAESELFLDLLNTTLTAGVLRLQLNDGSFKDIDFTSLLQSGGNFSCSDMATFVSCLQQEKAATGCTYDHDVVSSRLGGFPLIISRVQTTTGDIVVNIPGNDIDDLVANWNAAGLGLGAAVNQAGLFRLVGVPVPLLRIELTNATGECDWVTSDLLADSCTGEPSQVFQDFCECVNACVQYEIFPDECDIVLQNTEGVESRVAVSDVLLNCPAPDYCNYFTGV